MTEIISETTEQEIEAPIEAPTLEAQLEDVNDFLETANLKMYILPVHENPHRSPNEQNSALHYSCKLMNEKSDWFVVYFSKGYALRTWMQPSDDVRITHSHIHVPIGKIDTTYDGPMPPWEEDGSQQDQDTFNYCSKPEMPHIAEVLNCLARDCRGIEQSQGNFSTWCKMLETSDDSMYAKTTWDAILKQRQQLAALLGEGSYHQLVNETEALK